MTNVRAAIESDRAAFDEMWEDFVSAKPSEPGDRGMAATNWARVMDSGHPLRCIVALDAAGAPQGFTLFVQLPFTWSAGDVCYLEDIYVRPTSRGKGHAKAMIEHLKEIGSKGGWYKIFWMTEADNHAAQSLYEKVAVRMDYLRYDSVLSRPETAAKSTPHQSGSARHLPGAPARGRHRHGRGK